MTEGASRRRVAFWGLGSMGGPMAARLVEAGVCVYGFDPAVSAREHFAAGGGIPVDGPDQLVDVPTVILMLPNSDVVESVLSAGLAQSLPSGGVVIDMSSCEPLRTQALAEQLAERGIDLVDAPVSGGVTGARDGTLAIMVGGSKRAVSSVAGLLAHFGTPTHVGPSGAGHALKALNNLLSASHLWATSEAMLVGERFGLDPAVMLDAINRSSGRSGSTQNKWPNFILPGGYDSGFTIGLMYKDVNIATDLAHRLGVSMPFGDAAVAQWGRALQSMSPDADHTEVARFIAQAGEDSSLTALE